VLSLVRQCRGGRLYDATFGRRMRGEGPYAQLIERRFVTAKRRFGLATDSPPLRTDLFVPPAAERRQPRLL
jgi:DNA repair photolyase